MSRASLVFLGNSTRVLLTRGVLAIMIPWFPVDWVARGPPATQAPRTCSEASRSFAGGPLAAQQCESLNGTRAQASQLQSCFKLKAQTALVGPVVARADLPSQPRAENHWWPRRKSDPGGARSYYCNHEIIIATAQLLLQPRRYYCTSEVIIATKKLLLQAPCYYYCVSTQKNQWFSPRTTCNNNRVFAITTGALQ